MRFGQYFCTKFQDFTVHMRQWLNIFFQPLRLLLIVLCLLFVYIICFLYFFIELRREMKKIHIKFSGFSMRLVLIKNCVAIFLWHASISISNFGQFGALRLFRSQNLAYQGLLNGRTHFGKGLLARDPFVEFLTNCWILWYSAFNIPVTSEGKSTSLVLCT
jgi:hypothetical protein